MTPRAAACYEPSGRTRTAYSRLVRCDSDRRSHDRHTRNDRDLTFEPIIEFDVQFFEQFADSDIFERDFSRRGGRLRSRLRREQRSGRQEDE